MYKQSGLTLIELIVALGVLVLLITVGAPSLQGMLQSNQVTAKTNELVSTMHEARSAAVKQNGAVSVCANSLEGAEDAGNRWSNGWVVLSGSDCVGYTEGQVISETSQNAEGVSVAAAVESVTFRGDGSMTLGNGVTFELVNASYRRQVSVGSSGTVTSCRPQGEDGTCQ